MDILDVKEVDWFVYTLKNQFGINVDLKVIGYEATELGMDEVEDFFVPSELFDVLPESLVYEIIIVDDIENNVWVGAVAFYPDSPEWCLQVITKNGEKVFRQVLQIDHQN
ncbi:hypothetical protein MKZ20_03900 [Psychrobacillus sp. FSL K6-2684]|uniref:hypothetical protein n=1 Tax=Psychrobacillus sp. FSL K6-2684 TaxID=2921547 RepID=UPI0030F7323A